MITAAEPKKSTRAVYAALYESQTAEDSMVGGRKLFIVAPSWIRAAGKAVVSIRDGETLVDLALAKDAAVV